MFCRISYQTQKYDTSISVKIKLQNSHSFNINMKNVGTYSVILVFSIIAHISFKHTST